MYLGTIFLWPLSWVPEEFMFCNGQLLQVSQNQALFSLIGYTYGGDGHTTFALPDLRGRVPIGVGQGINLT
ncbi:MAG: phage tail protein, partial [Dolichospermum sp.]